MTMDDNDPKQNEPLDVEDFDMEDLDEDDSLGDDSWNEFDDADEPAKAGEKSKTAGQRTFVQKYFKLIVAGIVVVFGGLLMLGLMGGSSEPQPPAPAPETAGQAPDVVELPPNADMPPMPAPINTIPEEAAAPQEQPPEAAPAPPSVPEAAQTGQDVLTPLPEEKTEEEAALPEFDFSELPKVSGDEGQPMAPETEETAASHESVQAAPEMAAPGESESLAGNSEDMAAQLVPEESGETPAVPAPVVVATPDAETTRRIESLEQGIENTNRQIDDLVKSISSLEDKIETLADKQEQAAKAPPAPAAEAETPKPAPARAATPRPKKPAKTPAKAAAKATSWILRAAQPGRAVVASKGSNDLKTVEVGDTLAGIGRIVSVSMENGRWVVRGTQGALSQ